MTKIRRLWHHSGRAYIEYAPQEYGKAVATGYVDNRCGSFDIRDSYTCNAAVAQSSYDYWWRQGWLTSKPEGVGS